MKVLKSTLFCIFTTIFCFSMMIGVSGCVDEHGDGKIDIVCTIFPVYDWVQEIVGENDNIEITLLVKSGEDLHSYQPTIADMATIASCDVFVYVGGESDDVWVEKALANAVNKDMIKINLLQLLGENAKEEEIVEGMQGEQSDKAEYDEHIWLSLKNAQFFIDKLCLCLQQLNDIDAQNFISRANEYKQKLLLLDNEYTSAIQNAQKHTILFGDRFPFLYLVSDYNLSYYAAFSGCSSDVEASFQTIAFLSNKVDELGLNCILIIDNSSDKIAKAIRDNTQNKNQEILTLNSMQSSAYDSASYLSVMQQNLQVIKRALE